MLAVLAANPYLGLEDANFEEIFEFLAILGSIFVFLLVYRLVSIIFSARKDKKASLINKVLERFQNQVGLSEKQFRDISAGGVSLLASSTFDGL